MFISPDTILNPLHTYLTEQPKATFEQVRSTMFRYLSNQNFIHAFAQGLKALKCNDIAEETKNFPEKVELFYKELNSLLKKVILNEKRDAIKFVVFLYVHEIPHVLPELRRKSLTQILNAFCDFKDLKKEILEVVEYYTRYFDKPMRFYSASNIYKQIFDAVFVENEPSALDIKIVTDMNWLYLSVLHHEFNIGYVFEHIQFTADKSDTDFDIDSQVNRTIFTTYLNAFKNVLYRYTVNRPNHLLGFLNKIDVYDNPHSDTKRECFIINNKTPRLKLFETFPEVYLNEEIGQKMQNLEERYAFAYFKCFLYKGGFVYRTNELIMVTPLDFKLEIMAGVTSNVYNQVAIPVVTNILTTEQDIDNHLFLFETCTILTSDVHKNIENMLAETDNADLLTLFHKKHEHESELGIFIKNQVLNTSCLNVEIDKMIFTQKHHWVSYLNAENGKNASVSFLLKGCDIFTYRADYEERAQVIAESSYNREIINFLQKVKQLLSENEYISDKKYGVPEFKFLISRVVRGKVTVRDDKINLLNILDVDIENPCTLKSDAWEKGFVMYNAWLEIYSSSINTKKTTINIGQFQTLNTFLKCIENYKPK